MPELTQYMIKNGVPEELLGLILMVPIVATIIAFSREIIGIKGFGIYSSLIIAFAFWGAGLLNGTIIFVLVLVIGTLIRLMIRGLRLLYLPRMAIVLTGVAFAIFLMLLIFSFYTENEIFKLSTFRIIFPIIIILTLVERFVSAQIERGAMTAITFTVETFVLASLSFFIMDWGWLKALILDWPLAVFGGAIILNIILGKWTGLRLTELLRFREVIRYVELPSKK